MSQKNRSMFHCSLVGLVQDLAFIVLKKKQESKTVPNGVGKVIGYFISCRGTNLDLLRFV